MNPLHLPALHKLPAHIASISLQSLKAFTVIISLVCSLQTSSAQNLNVAYPHVEVMTPEAAKIAQYADVPVSYYTGVPDISIPLYTIDASGYEIPITLNYHASGIKVSEEATWVGLGWSLNAGGMVSRTVNGTDDFLEHGWDRAYPYVKKGYYDAPRFYTDYSQLYDTVAVSPNFPGVLAKLELNLRYDTEPDIFFYSIPGYSGKFILDKDKGAVLFDKSQNIKVEILKVSRPAQIAIKLTDNQGNQYLFERECVSLNYATNEALNKNGTDPQNIYDDNTNSYISWTYCEPTDDYDAGPAAPYEMTTSWMLTEIKTNRNRHIYFDYEKESQYLPAQESCETYNSQKHGRSTFYYKSKIVNYSWRLSHIHWDFGSVSFTTDSRDDIKGDAQKLLSFTVKDKSGRNLRKVSFDYGYFDDGYDGSYEHVFKRLRLDSVSIFSPLDGASEGKYTFEYYLGEFPAKNTKNVDYWGYQNGRDYGKDYSVGVNIDGLGSYPGVTKDADIEKTIIGTLKQINYPTGGYSKFTYEGNDIGGYFNNITNNDLGEHGSQNSQNTTYDELHMAVFNNYMSDEHPELPETDTLTFQVSSDMYVDISAHLENHNSMLKDEDYMYHYDLLCTLTNFDTKRIEYKEECPYLFDTGETGSVDQTGEGCEYEVNSKRVNLSTGTYQIVLNKPPKDVSSDWTFHFSGKVVTLNNDGSRKAGGSDTQPTSSQKRTTYGAGLRITKIETNNSTRTFAYSQGSILTTPVLWYYSKRAGYTDTDAPALVQTSESKTPLSTFGNGNFVGYDWVEERVQSGDKDFCYRHYFVNEEESEQFDDNFPDSPFLIRYGNGFPSKIELYEDGDLKESVAYNYIKRKHERIYALRDKSQHKSSDFMLPYFYDIEWPLNNKKSTVVYESNGSYTEDETYGYNDANLINSIEKKCGSSTYTTKVKYSTDFNTQPYVQMADSNIVAIPIENITLRNGMIVEGSSLEYKDSLGIFLPKRLNIIETKVALPESDYSSSLKPDISFSHYDKYGNPVEIIFRDKPVTYLWQNHGESLAAQIEGINYPHVLSVLGGNTSKLNNGCYENKEEVGNLLQPLKNINAPCKLRYFSSRPLTGITSITEPNGGTAYFRYDGLGRLKEVDDNEKTPKSKVKYDIPSRYVRTDIMLDNSGDQYVTSIGYIDPLGRPAQTSSNGIGGGGRYVNTFQTFNEVGKTNRQYLPSIGGSAPYPMTEYNALSQTSSTYSDDYAYSENVYDVLGRLESTSSPGEAWYDDDKRITKRYIVNGKNDVWLYAAPMDGKNQLVKSGYYDTGVLRGEVTTDEDGHSLTVFTDFTGRKVLERRNSESGNNDTYFVYNDLGQLRFVLSPEYQNEGHKAIYAYEYRYDERGNIVKKILPQCEYIQYWYDKANRMTFMQDGRMRQQGKYWFYLYDNLSRVVVEGLCSGGNRGGTIRNVSFNPSGSGFFGTGYTVDNNLNLVSPQLETVNYYDDYEYLKLPLFKDNAALKKISTPSSPVCAKGFVTGSINATNRGELLLTSLYYDIKGEVTESRRTLPENALLVTKNVYTFTGNTENTEETLYKGGKTYKAAKASTYNPHNDRIASASLSIDGNASHKISSVTYDDLGRVKEISRGEGSGETYDYNLRSWITDITGRNFEEHLTYNAGSYGTPYYNGNISTQQWKTSDDNILRGYKFTYDKLNRLVNSVYGEGASFSVNENRYSEAIPEYTANGAMKKIVRNGLKQEGTYGAVDNLNITLTGNQLQRVDDNAAPVLRTGASDFYDDKIKTDVAEYEYDVNGALTMDANRGIAKIEYDLRDNPTLIQFSDGSQTEYVYSSTGEKLRTIHRTASPNISVSLGETIRLDNPISSDSTDYIGSFIFENGKPDKYLFSGGYYTYATPKAGYSNYHYFLTDHLGNNRVVVNENDSLEQVTHYYPFGTVYVDAGLDPDLQKYKYNGKELDLMHGLNSYDYGARQYYAVVPAWDRMDPLCEKYYCISPYAYCGNNPIKHIDPNGCWYWEKNGNLHAEENDNTKTMADFLGTSQKNVLQILHRNKISTGKGGRIKVENISKLSLDKNSLYVMQADKSGVVLEDEVGLALNMSPLTGSKTMTGPHHDLLAVSHYYLGQGEAADVGDYATALLMNTKRFRINLKAIMTQKKGTDKVTFTVNMTNKVFHIGKTPVTYQIRPGNKTSQVNFYLYQYKNGKTDAFKDPLDIGIEVGGTPYYYKHRIVKYFFKSVK